MGCTKRTVQRWEDRGALLVQPELEALARAVYPVRPDLVEQIAAASEMTLEQIRVVPGAPLAPSAAPDRIESIVFAAAHAMAVTPDAIRPALAVAFERARDEGLSPEDIADALGRAEKPATDQQA